MTTRFTLFFLFISGAVYAQVDGTWYAMLDAMGTELPLSIELRYAAGDELDGVLVSPSQNNARLPLTSVDVDGVRVAFGVEPIGASFNGVLDGKEIRGVFQQAQVDFPLTFTRYRPDHYPIGEGPLTIRARSQEPREFPYERREVTFPGGADGVTLAGELTLPQDGQPKALIVLVSGSGPQDRNSYLGSQINHKPFLVLSDYLTRRGYGVLRYDDRGTAQSTGNYATATTADLAQDAHAAVRYLRTLPALANVPLGLAGHSEGGMIAPLVANADGKLDFIILLAAPAQPITKIVRAQSEALADEMNMPEDMRQRNRLLNDLIHTYVLENQDLSDTAFVNGLHRALEPTVKMYPEALQRAIRKDSRAFNAQYVQPLRSPWARYYLAFDPQEHLEQLKVPTLALNGLTDKQVPALDNLNAISSALARAGNDEVTVVPLPGLNHLFQPSETGSVREYGTIETTFDEAALEAIGGWLEGRFD